MRCPLSGTFPVRLSYPPAAALLIAKTRKTRIDRRTKNRFSATDDALSPKRDSFARLLPPLVC
jgi:hypothetical protein